MADDNLPIQEDDVNKDRRSFLVASGKWSMAVVAGAIFGSNMFRGKNAEARSAAWANRRGGGGAAWGNGGGGGGAWRNGGGGGGAWRNSSGAWRNGGGGAWRNGGGGGGAWGNRRY